MTDIADSRPQEASEDISEDALLGGRLRLRQPATGYRVAIDPVFLAAAVPAVAGEHVLDVGAGVGAAALCLAARVPGCRVTGLEIQHDLVRLAAENAGLNDFQDRIDVMAGDLTRPPPGLAAGGFDHVMANPPHLDAARADPSPHESRAVATVEGRGDLADWLRFCLAMVRPRGSVTLIHRADRLDELLAGLSGPGLSGPGLSGPGLAGSGLAGAIVVFPLWPDEARRRPAKRVIVQARRGLRTPLRLAPGLALHGDGGGYTAAAEAVLREAAALEL